ncbi:MAG TPA: histidine kinase [Prolixibacteraceae bacterium]|nr:histidine kinase [Prolixibacteraceae bacterium]
MLKKLQAYLFNNRIFQSLLFSAIITAVVALMWDMPLERFKLNQTGEVSNASKGERLWFFGDFDNDGNTEKLRCSISSYTSRFSIVAYNHENKIIATPHFQQDYWIPNMKPAIKDINNDGVKDFMFFSLIGDSVFFTVIDILTGTPLIDHLFFMQVERFSEKMGIQSEFYTGIESNKGDKNEILFFFDAGYGLYPRGLFKLNLKKREFTIPEKTYSPYNLAGIKDLNNDGKPEFLTRTYAPSNISFETEYPDNQCYIAVYTSDLNYLFPPIPIKGEFSNVMSCPDPNSDSLFYAAYRSKSDTGEENQVMAISQKGEIIKRAELPALNYELMGGSLLILQNKPCFFINNYGYYHLTPNLRNIPEKTEHIINDQYAGLSLSVDLNFDGTKELTSFSLNKFFVHNLKFDHTISIELPIKPGEYEILPFHTNGKVKKFTFLTGGSYFFFTYIKNPWYFTIYLIHFGLFIFFAGITYLLLYLQQQRLERKWSVEKQLSELQFIAVKNQLHPHFMFNALNSVAYMINSGHKDEAYDFLTVNSRMIQRVMDDAKEVKRKLKDEIQFTKDYLHIQQHRFKDKFSTKIEVHPKVDLNFQLPKMCIHTYAENAVKHGFRNTQKNGLLSIKILPLNAGVQIIIADNGMGRKEAAKHKDSSGHGLKTMEEFYRLFEKYYGYKIELKITDANPSIYAQIGMRAELKIQNTGDAAG